MYNDEDFNHADRPYQKLDDKIKELNSTRVYKKITPKSGLSWYVKWVSVVFVVMGWMLHAINLFPYNIALSMVGVAGWLWVGMLWHDRALIVLNSIGVVLLGLGLLKHMVGL